jgi:hypothetical protein
VIGCSDHATMATFLSGKYYVLYKVQSVFSDEIICVVSGLKVSVHFVLYKGCGDPGGYDR